MTLPLHEVELFFKLYDALLRFIGLQLQLLEPSRQGTRAAGIPLAKRRKLTRALASRLDLIDSFLAVNPESFSPAELEIVSSWRHLMAGRFVALRQHGQHMILLPCSESKTVYGVAGLFEPLRQAIGEPMPALIETVLAPFRDSIVCPLILRRFKHGYTPDSRSFFEEDYRQAKEAGRFFTSLPAVPSPKRKPAQTKKARTPAGDVGPVLNRITRMTDDFCGTRLNEEYAMLCRKLAAKLAAKRPSPLLRGMAETWACAIVRTAGWANFLDDRTQNPYLRMPEIDRVFGIAESTAQGRCRQIRDMLRIRRFDHRWTLPSRWENESMIWTLTDATSGRLIDVREEAPAMQRSAFRQGLVPYVPADRAAAAVRQRIEADPARRLFQFKISLRGTDPLVWRRIQVLDATLDKLHEHIQTAMGWTNSHLHEFAIGERRCGDPELLDDGFEPVRPLVNSRLTPISKVFPPEAAPLAFEYLYDFGDGWAHDVLFEGSPQPQAGAVYPLCLEGARACPPEDCGGISGFARLLEALADPNHPEHASMLEWSGSYDPNAFAPRLTSHVMQEGVPDWRNAK